MATTTAITASLISTGVSIYNARKKPPTPVTPNLPVAPDLQAETRAANLAAQNAAFMARRKAAAGLGRASTITTSPQGVVGAPAPGKTTLLGL